MVALQAALLLLLASAALATPAPEPEQAVEAGMQSAAPPPRLRRFQRFQEFRRRRLRHVTRVPKRNALLGDIKTRTLDQRRDHFDPSSTVTWSQRYFERKDLYQEGGPVFIHIGGESKESEATLDDEVLFMTYLAETFRAKTYNLEHRYYGESQPTEELAAEDMVYLSADQALADLAYFILHLRKKGEIAEGQKVAVFGGSYPGNLAAWARIKYPHLVHAAVASSAPVRAKADFVEYMEVVGRSLVKMSGQKCYDNVKMATDRVAKLLATDAGYESVRTTFHVGSDLKDKLDLDTFFEALSSPFASAVQYDSAGSPDGIKAVCKQMGGDLTPDEAVAKLAPLVLGDDATTTEPLDFSYQGEVDLLKQTAYRTDGMRQWLHQTCTEFGYFQTFSGTGVPFPQAYNAVDYDYQLCKDIFGSAFDESVVTSAVERTNLVFGSRTPVLTNTIFVNGNVDPWHALGVLEDLPDAPAILIDGGSHCADMDYPWLYDTAEITAAHESIHRFLRAALYEEADGSAATP